MPWIVATLRGQKVFARAKPTGELSVDKGRVEIRYKQTDGRPYHASAGNLVVTKGSELLPDDACATAASTSTPVARPRLSAPQVGAQWIAYTDGACSGNPGPAGSGMVVIAPGGKIHEGFEYLGLATNNVAELTAILRGVEAIPRSATSVAIMTDSKYAIGVLTKGWKPKANQVLVGEARRSLSGRPVQLVYVPGHSGVPMNERADELAREAITARRSKPLPKLEGEAS